MPGFEAPPAVIGDARVVAFARVLRDTETVALAVTEGLDDSRALSLLYCAGDWSVQRQLHGTSESDLRDYAQRDHADEQIEWQPTYVDREAALAIYDALGPTQKCSFCRKRAFEVALLIEGSRGVICNECVARFRSAISAQ